MGAQGDVDLVVHVEPFRMVVQLLSLQGHSCHEPESPVEVFEVELLEDGVAALQLIPPHGPQVWQQLVPLLSTQPVCFASLQEGGDTGPGPFFLQADGALLSWCRLQMCGVVIWVSEPKSWDLLCTQQAAPGSSKAVTRPQNKYMDLYRQGHA